MGGPLTRNQRKEREGRASLTNYKKSPVFKIKRKYLQRLQRTGASPNRKSTWKRLQNKWLKCDLCIGRYFKGWKSIKEHKEKIHCVPALFARGHVEVFLEKPNSLQIPRLSERVQVDTKMSLKRKNRSRKNWDSAMRTSIRFLMEKEGLVQGASITEIEYVIMLMYFKNFEHFRTKVAKALARQIRKGKVIKKVDPEGHPIYALADKINNNEETDPTN
ncbi:hypothetical protein Ocin01_08786 [Orchesella cincta]|uniref:Uncharacterized protein n=1 Tax=Orchesella cincta TaxID=48709 RepID=A0A1D2MZ21_ORCCI|nr:hypothetical protein Ocin01_08786 [Orchesella cincta]